MSVFVRQWDLFLRDKMEMQVNFKDQHRLTKGQIYHDHHHGRRSIDCFVFLEGVKKGSRQKQDMFA